MRNRTSRYGITKVLALTLALLLTLGNLPLVSFATETGGTAAADPAEKKAEDFKYKYRTHFYFATGRVGDDVLQYPGGKGKWWPVQNIDPNIFGTIVSDKLNLRNDADVYEKKDEAANDQMGLVIGKHYPARYQRFNDIQLSVKYQENGQNKETKLFPATVEGFGRPEVREAFAKYIESREDKRVVTYDHRTGEELVITPDNMRSGEISIHPMRYIKYVSKPNTADEYRRIHVDLYVIREKAQPITVEEYVDDATNPTQKENQGNLGTVLNLKKPGFTIEKVEVTVDGTSTTIALKEGSTVEDQLTKQPITHDTKAKTVKVWYRTIPSAGIEVVAHHISFFPLLPQQDQNIEVKDRNIDQTLLEQYRFNDFIKYIAADGREQVQTKVDAKKPGTIDKFKISAPTHPTQQLEIQKVSLLEDGKIIEDSIDSVKEVYTIEHKQGKKISLHVYYKIRNVKVNAYTLEDGVETHLGEFLVPMDADYSLDKIFDAVQVPAKDKLEGVSLNKADSALIEAKDLIGGNTIPKAKIDKDITKIYLHYEGRPQSSKITIYEVLGEKEQRKAEETGLIGKQHRIQYRNKILTNYDFDGIYIDGEKLTDTERVFSVTKAEHKVVFKYRKKAPTKEYSIRITAQVNGNLHDDKVEVLKGAENTMIDLKPSLEKMRALRFEDYQFDTFLLVLEKDAYGNIVRSEEFQQEEIQNLDRDYDIVANYVSKKVNIKILVFKDGKPVENFFKMEEHDKNSNYEVKEGEGIIKQLREEEAFKPLLNLEGFKLDKAEAFIGIPPSEDAEPRDGKFFSLMDEKGYTLNLYFISAHGIGGTGDNGDNNNTGNTGDAGDNNNNAGNTGDAGNNNNNAGNTGDAGDNNNNAGNTGDAGDNNNNAGNTGDAGNNNNNAGNTGDAGNNNNNAGNTGDAGNNNNNAGNTGDAGDSGGSTTSNTESARDSYRRYDGPGVASNTANNDEITIEEDTTPLGALNHNDYFAYIQGYPDGSVRSNNYVNREETAAIFFRLLDPKYKEAIRSDENNFKDITKETWSNKHISTLANGGIIRGYADGSFRPRAAITRGELAVIAAKFDRLSGNSSHNFKDVKGHWAENYIANASAKGWIQGYPNGEFRPDSPITRAEFATFINKVLGRNVKKTEVLPGVKSFTDLSTNAWYYEAMVTATNSYIADKGQDGYQKWTELVEVLVEM